ncbi:MAG: adenosylcobinamide-GDP ribazoletransferase [Firmicutes bacterium]|nr:adenosylcobinamide-GDP ribazoletransferase [Bacillota bacterium]
MSWIKAFFMAWGMFLAIPCPFPCWDEKLRDRMLIALPFAGLMIGSLWAGAAALLLKLGCPALIRAALLCAFPHLASGFIHLDGFMDCCDAVLSRKDPEAARKILKDPHAGSFAVISLALLLMLSFAAFSELEISSRLTGLIALPAVTRACSAAAIFFIGPMEGSSYEKMERKLKGSALAVLAAMIAAGLAFGIRSGTASLAAASVSLLSTLRASKKLGGMSGDVSGLAVSLGEAAGVLVLALL